MAVLDDELLRDAEEDAREAEFIRNSLSSELKARFTDEQIRYMMDAIVEYYYESGVLESDEEEIDIDLQQIAEYVSRRAEEDGIGQLAADDVFFVVQADMDFQEQNL
ncbi:MAG: hypothetical protein IJ710_11190 [Prevotella sp.]|nr:hypothetical protein [Prevotella sp.]